MLVRRGSASTSLCPGHLQDDLVTAAAAAAAAVAAAAAP